jgi:hypothetical protein
MLAEDFLWAPKSQVNSGFLHHDCLKIEQGYGWMRAGAVKRPSWPMNASKFSLLASTNTGFGAQTLLNFYAMCPVWARGATGWIRVGSGNRAGQMPGPIRRGIYCSGLPTGAAVAGSGMAVGAEAAGADGLLAARFWPVPALACSSYSAPRFSMALA